MTTALVTTVKRFVGPASERLTTAAPPGSLWEASDTAIIYKMGEDGATWFSEALSSAPLTGLGAPTTITRPANQTPYTAGDAVGGALDLGVLGQAGKETVFTSIQLQLRITAVPTGMTSFLLALYNVTPPSAIADNGAWTLPVGDRASYLGIINLGSPALPVAGALYLETEPDGFNKQITLLGTHVFAYLITVGGFTPAANSEVYVITPHTVPV